MATVNVVGIRKRWRRRTLRRGGRKYNGQKGWNWQEPILSNAFTDIDNVPANVELLMQGDAFSTPASGVVGGAQVSTVVVRAMHLQCQVSVLLPDVELYPLVAYDVALVKFETTATLGASPIDLQGIQLDTNNRVFFHKRVWAASQPGGFNTGEDLQTYGVNPASSFIDVSLRKLNIPITETEQIGIVLSQCQSELYTDGTDALLTGYVKSYVQIK